MLTLSLLRHAKSSWDDASMRDFDRPLAKRGVKAASRMGAFMAAQGLSPNLILCSTAERARATLALVLRELDAEEADVRFEDGLYLAEANALRARIGGIGASVKHALLVGHNPGLQSLAVSLAGTGPARDLAKLAAKFPTGGLAVLTFEVPEWSGVGAGSGRLALFMTPRRLS
jgi:phosphohistidine phosphatase